MSLDRSKKTLRILGIRGIPAAHGGFETFAEKLAIYLSEKGWRVIVYCQSSENKINSSDVWNSIERVHIAAPDSSLGTMYFDLLSILDASKSKDLCLTLGYNTAIFCLVLKIKGVFNIINMDGVEWRRDKWGKLAKLWFWINERIGCYLGNNLVADHPRIADHLAKIVPMDKITMIPYGGEHLNNCPSDVIERFGICSKKYLTVIARPEPENSIFEIVSVFSSKPRGVKLVVLGKYDSENPYHAKVVNAASNEVIFLGAIYDKAVLASLRYHSLAYVHGHTVGGTNPSLVEALGAGNAVVAHDNKYNRWVAGKGALYFSTEDDLDFIFSNSIFNVDMISALRKESLSRFSDELNWPAVLGAYESLLQKYV